MKTLFLMLLGLCVSLGGRAAEPAIDAVKRADQARLQAMMAGDGAALGRVLSDALVFGHSDGRLESKADYVKNLMAGDTAYADARVSEVHTLQATNDVVVIHGRQTMRKRLGPKWDDLELRFMAIWRNESGTWRMVAWQSLRPSGNSIVPAK